MTFSQRAIARIGAIGAPCRPLISHGSPAGRLIVSNWQRRGRNEGPFYSGRSQKSPNTNPVTFRNLKKVQESNLPPNMIKVAHNGVDMTLDPIHLRDSCRCPKCKDPSSQQKLFQTCDIPTEIQGMASVEGESLVIKWTNDIPGYGREHKTHIPLLWLHGKTFQSQFKHYFQTPQIPWNQKQIEAANKWVDYEKYINSDEELYESLDHLKKYGLLFLRNVPEDEKSVVHIAERVGTLKDTFYGRTWDVRSVPDAKNIAYTEQFLGFHMDLLYVEQPPKIQLLHSLRARAPGGESLFTDCLQAASILWKSHPNYARALAKYPVVYEYKNDAQHYRKSRRTLDMTRLSSSEVPEFTNFHWSPPFQTDFPLSFNNDKIDDWRRYHKAASEFDKLLQSPGSVFKYRMEEGECVLFDNRRVLHSRNAFDSSKGERWLKGAYLDSDVFNSKLAVLAERFQQSNNLDES